MKRGVVLLVGLLLVLAQALVLVHRIAHAEHGVGSESAAASSATLWVADEDGREDGHDCEAFDHAGSGDGVPAVSLLGLTTSMSRDAAVPSRSPLLAAEAAGFLARGPPPSLSS